ncbi:MAG: hypothetical protein IJ375_04395 [Oscillospiraceae bacterium]|nr:hypothetical protein [Oscillospiraceae bacterium]
MEGSYELLIGTKPAGQVTVRREGLYWHFSCRCRLSGDVVCRLTVRCGGNEENLGILVPMDGQFGLEKKLPCKRLGEGVPEFLVQPKHEAVEGKFVPIYPEEPFAYMAKLKDAFLATQAGQLGIVIRE